MYCILIQYCDAIFIIECFDTLEWVNNLVNMVFLIWLILYIKAIILINNLISFTKTTTKQNFYLNQIIASYMVIYLHVYNYLDLGGNKYSCCMNHMYIYMFAIFLELLILKCTLMYNYCL